MSAGIPDFRFVTCNCCSDGVYTVACRSPGTGLYSKLDHYGLPYPEAVFDIEFFRRNPRPFFELAKDLHPGKLGLEPTLAHFFIVLLAQKGILRRMYTQNIDTLERLAGLPSEQLVEAHGSFASATCTRCGAQYDAHWVERAISLDPVEDVDIVPRCERCASSAPVKPDITFFGEELPRRFKDLATQDMASADMCLVLGSSLQVAPVNSLFTQVPPTCPRVLINLHSAGEAVDINSEADLQGLTQAQLATLISAGGDGGFRFNLEDNYRDVFLQGRCDEQVLQLATAAGWKEELLQLQTTQLHQLRERRSLEQQGRAQDSGTEAPTSEALPQHTPQQSKRCDDLPSTHVHVEAEGHSHQDVPGDEHIVPCGTGGSLTLQQALQGAAATGITLSGAAVGSDEAAAAGEAALERAEAAWSVAGMSVLDDAMAVLADAEDAASAK